MERREVENPKTDIVETVQPPELLSMLEDSSCHLQFTVYRYGQEQAFELPLVVLPYPDAQALYMQLNSYLEAQLEYNAEFRKPPGA